MELAQGKSSVLLAVDFDHTLIDANADLSLCKLAPHGSIPEDIQSMYNRRGWVNYMGAVFRFLHQHGISKEDIQKHVEALPLTPGMMELFEYVRSKSHHDIVIISDSNSVLINYLLRYHHLDGLVSQVFTNPAEYDSDGCLLVRNYHDQDWCPISTVHLCKGHILQEFIKDCRKEGRFYSRVVYIGDGSNDLCPGLTLSDKDYLLARKGFSLWKKLEESNGGETMSGKKVKASVIGWESALEIQTFLQKLDESDDS